MKRCLMIIFLINFFSVSYADQDVDQVKGIGTSFWSMLKTVPQGFISFWKNIKLLGSAPDGYYYQYLIFNDTTTPAWVGTQQMRSIMGGVFPQSHSWNCQEVTGNSMFPATTQITITSTKASKGSSSQKTGIITNCAKQDFYFEMFIKTTDKAYSNHMPYLEHDDTLVQVDKLDLSPEDKNSNYCNVYRVYMGKKLNGGEYVHSLRSEVVGPVSTSSTLYKNAIGMDTNVESINIKNSTDKDYYVGFFPGSSSTFLSSKALFLGLVEKNSFGLLRTVGSVTSFAPGTIAIYESNLNASPIMTIAVPKYSFNSLPYTLEIYKDPGQTQVVCNWQGIMPGHYDMPTGKIKDITPIIGVFWYESAAQATKASKSNQSSGYDLPGSVWIVSYEKNSKKNKILGAAKPGDLIYFQIERPAIGDKKDIYFLYIDSTDVNKVNNFIQNFISGTTSESIMNVYEKKLDSVMDASATSLSMIKAKSSSLKNQSAKNGSEMNTMINQMALNSIQMNRGQITDSQSGLTGYMLGKDIFMPVGMGADPQYYVLTPSISAFEAKDIASNPKLLKPTSSVQNYMTSAPQGLPTSPATNTYAPITYSVAAKS